MAFDIPRPSNVVIAARVPDFSEQLKNIMAAQLTQARIQALRQRMAQGAGGGTTSIYDPATGKTRDANIAGRSAKERAAAQQSLQDQALTNFLAQNETIQQNFNNWENLDVQRKDAALKKAEADALKMLPDTTPPEIRERFTDIVQNYFQPRRDAVLQEYQAVENADDWQYWKDSARLGLQRFTDALGSIGESPEELRERNRKFNEFEQSVREQNPYMMDQYRRAQHGEGMFEQMTGKAGNIANNLLGGLLSSPVETGIPAVAAAATLPLSMPAAALVGSLAGVASMAPSMGWEYQRNILNDNTLSTAEQDAALDSGTNTARGLGAMVGLLPAAAGRVARTLGGTIGSKAGKAALDAQYRAAATAAAGEAGRAAPQFSNNFLARAARIGAQREANAGRFGHAIQGTGAAGVEGFISGGAEQFAQNVANRVGTGRDVNLLEGTLDAALYEAAIGAPVGTATGIFRGPAQNASAPAGTPPPTEAAGSAGATPPAATNAGAALQRMEYDRQFRAQLREWEQTGQPVSAEVVDGFKRQYIGDNTRTEEEWANFVNNNAKVAQTAQLSPTLQSALEGSLGKATLDPSEVLTTSRRPESVYDTLDEGRMGIAQSLFKELNKTKTGQTEKAVEIIRNHMDQGLTAEEVSAIVTVASQKRTPDAKGKVVDALLNRSLNKAARANAKKAFSRLNKDAADRKAQQMADLSRNMSNLQDQVENLNGPASNVEPPQSGTAAAGSEPVTDGDSGVAAPATGTVADSPAGNADNASEGGGAPQGGGSGRSTEPDNGAAVPTQGDAQGAQPVAPEDGTQRGSGTGNAAPASTATDQGAGAPATEGDGSAPRAGDEANAGSTVDAGSSSEQRSVDDLSESPFEPGLRADSVADPVPADADSVDVVAQDDALTEALDALDPEIDFLGQRIRDSLDGTVDTESATVAAYMLRSLSNAINTDAQTLFDSITFTTSPDVLGRGQEQLYGVSRSIKRRTADGEFRIGNRLIFINPDGEVPGRTLLHETAHFFATEASYRLQAVPERLYTTAMRQLKQDMQALAKFVGASNTEYSAWSKDQRERLVNAFELYMDGAPNAAPASVRPIFERVAQFFRSLVRSIMGAPRNQLSPSGLRRVEVFTQGLDSEVRNAFDRWVSGYDTTDIPPQYRDKLNAYTDARAMLDDTIMRHYKAHEGEPDALANAVAYGINSMGGVMPTIENLQPYTDSASSVVTPPSKSVRAYKLFRIDKKRPGQLFPLFVNANQPIPMGQWLAAESGPITTGGKVKSKLGPLAYRPGWHAGDAPVATHIGGKNTGEKAPSYRPDNQVWAEVEVANDVDWQSVANERARVGKNGKLVLSTAHITDQVPHGGMYRYKTNPNMRGNWIISGEMKVNRILSDAEVQRINESFGFHDLPRQTPVDWKQYGFTEPVDPDTLNQLDADFANNPSAEIC